MTADGTRPCPHCDSEIKAGATICKYCREDVEPLAAPPPSPPPGPTSTPTPATSGQTSTRTPAAWVLTLVVFGVLYLLKRFYCN